MASMMVLTTSLYCYYIFVCAMPPPNPASLYILYIKKSIYKNSTCNTCIFHFHRPIIKVFNLNSSWFTIEITIWTILDNFLINTDDSNSLAGQAAKCHGIRHTSTIRPRLLHSIRTNHRSTLIYE